MSSNEVQYEFFSKPKPRGGKRTGAGRKSKRGKTCVIRVPEAYRGPLNELFALLDTIPEDELPSIQVSIKNNKQ